MNVVLLAATGQAGRTILNELITRGHSVTAVARNPSKLPAQLPDTVKRVSYDLSNAERIAEIIAGADAVVSAFGLHATIQDLPRISATPISCSALQSV